MVLILVPISIYAQEKRTFSDSTTICKNVTSKYFNAYINLDFDALMPLMPDEISFQDPTAKFVFGAEKIEGKINVYENFKTSYASITEMKQETIRTIFSSNIGLFETNLVWKFKNEPDKLNYH